MKFFPDSLPKNRLPDREYFFNILNTCNQEYVKGLIDHALKMRNSAEGFNFETESISISQNIIDILHLKRCFYKWKLSRDNSGIVQDIYLNQFGLGNNRKSMLIPNN